MVINDSVQNYRGTPYERTLLHAFAATDHLALSDWESAAVEARRILISLDPGARGDYPDVAYARYMAGLCLQLIDDDSNAALQFRKAAEVATAVPIDDRTGRLGPEAAQSGTWPAELVCFVQIGATPRGDTTWKDRGTPEKTMYAEIVHDGKVLGRSYNLSDTVELGFTTAQKQAVKKAVKSAARIAAKETIAYQVGHDNALMGELVRLVLIGLLEQPDTRRWETMPRWLQVARVPCPPDLKSFDVIFKTSSGVTTRTVTVTQPLGRRRNTFVSFCRDLPVYTGPARDLQPKIPAAPPVPAAPSTPTAPN